MEKQIFYFERLKKWDKISIISYFILTIIIYYYLIKSDLITQNEIIFNYMFLTHFFIYFLNYKSLRNLSVYFIWILFSLIHLYTYYQIDILNTHYATELPHSIKTLKNTILLLFLFQILRFISAKIQNQELVCPTRIDTNDIFDNRKPTIIDWISLFIFFGTDIYLSY